MVNDSFFFNELDLTNIEFEISNRMTRTLGNIYHYRSTGRIVIKLSSCIIGDSKVVWNTMTHELIHLAQLQKNHPLGHGLFFQSECDRINKIDSELYLARTNDVPAEVAQVIRSKRIDRLRDKTVKIENKRIMIRFYDLTTGWTGQFFMLESLDMTMKKLRRELRKLNKTNYKGTCQIAIGDHSFMEYDFAAQKLRSMF